MSRQPRFWWAGSEKGWIVDVVKDITGPELDYYIEYVLRTQLQRLKGLLPGPKHDECLETIAALKAKRVTQNFVTREVVPFDAYKTTERKVFA